jgi:hypothetical protein
MKTYLSRIFGYWMALGHLIGLVMTPVQLLLVYVFAIGPASLGALVLRKDPLDRKVDNPPTFWRKKDLPPHTLENLRRTF